LIADLGGYDRRRARALCVIINFIVGCSKFDNIIHNKHNTRVARVFG
jgi:hypothetical protein